MTSSSSFDDVGARPHDAFAHAPPPIEDHLVQFYENEESLSEVVTTFLAAGLGANEPAIIIATQAHGARFRDRLASTGFDVEHAIATGNLTFLDARETLSHLMVDGSPRWERFYRIIGGLIAQTARATGGRPLRAYGEMVDLLWNDGNPSAALRLEEMWNELQRDQPFKLLCAYVMGGFNDDASGLHDICKSHGTVLALAPRKTHSLSKDGVTPIGALHRQQGEKTIRNSFGELRRAEEELRDRQLELHDVVEHAPVGIHRVRHDGVILWANRAELELLGYDSDEYIGRNIADFHVDARVASEFLTRLGRGETLHNFEALLRTRDGSSKQVSVSSNVQWRGGRVVYARSFTRDVSELKRNQRETENARERAELLYQLVGGVVGAQTANEIFNAALDALGAALHTSRSSVLVFDAEGTMRFRAWRGLSDGYRKAVEGHSPWKRDAQNPAPIIVSDVENDPTTASFLPLFRNEGIGALAFIPLVAAGRLIGKFMVYYDGPRGLSSEELDLARAIANHVASATSRFAAVHELERAVHFNEMFTAILGHDLRNPLSGILATAQMAIRRDDASRISQPLERIITSGKRMARMIDQLLDFTRARLGAGIPLQPKPVDLLPLVRQVLEELGPAHPERGFHLHHEGDTSGVWDDDRLCQIFSNLVGNATQHGLPATGIDIRIDGTGADAVRIGVHNMGTVPAELVPRLFEPMTGGDRRREKSNGLGLGLFITQQIAKAHGGHVEVTSADGTGTTFTVVLPRAAAGYER